MTEPNSPIFDRIVLNVVEKLTDDEMFTEDIVQQVKWLLDTGKVAEKDNVVKVLEGRSGENPYS